jgi:putative ABC transport system permease protein
MENDSEVCGMHNSLWLILKNAIRNKRRSFLTAASMATSLCVLGLIFSLYRVLFASGDQTSAAALRLITHHKISLTEELPVSYEDKIQKIEGVKAVTSLRWFGATYKDARDPNNQFAQFAIQPQAFLQVYPEIKLSEQAQYAFLTQKTAAIAGSGLAAKLHWRPGERITLVSRNSPITLELTLIGTYDASDLIWGDALYFNRQYLEDSLPATDRRRGMVQQYYIAAANRGDVGHVASAVDALFSESTAPTMTENERAFMLSFIAFIGNVKLFLIAICSAVTFAIVLVSANAISMSVRERTHEVGILKTLGYSSAEILEIVLGESLSVGLAGGVIGCFAAQGLCLALARAAHASPALRSLNSISMTPLTILLTLAAAAIVAAVSAAIPARNASQTTIIEALAYGG